MSKFNKKGTMVSRTVNLAGGEAFVMDPKLQFVTLLLTSFVKDQFYRSEDETIDTIRQLVHRMPDKKFAAKAAIYARTKFGMRSVSHLVAGEIANTVKGEEWTKNFYDKVVYRVDDMAEIFSFYTSQYGTPIPNSLKKGLAMAFDKFDEYQLGKYRGEGRDVKLIDIVNLVHPKPVEKNSEALKKLVKDELRSKNTFQVGLSEIGKKDTTDEQKEEMKAAEWKRLIVEKKLGYFALLKNLRNILEQSPESIPYAITMLTDRSLIKKSLVLPFRFTTAIGEIEKVSGVYTTQVRQVLVSLNTAIDLSLDNVPKFDGSTLVVLDESGSMNGQPIEIGALFAAVLVKANNADYMSFSDSARYINLNPADSTLTITKGIINGIESGGTNFHAIFEEANKVYNRIIILSDMQGWVGYDVPTKTFEQYKTRVGANPIVYSFDLTGYGTLQMPQQNIYCLAGFSDKIFDIMKLLETDRNALVSEIENIEL